MLDLPTEALAWVITFVAAIVQGTIGTGFAIFSVPLLTLIDPSLTPIPQILLAFPMTFGAVWRERQHIDLDGIWWIISGRVPGTLAAAWMLTQITEKTFDLVIASIVLAFVLVIGRGWEIRLNNRNRLLAGVASGFGGTASAIGGPPVILLYRNTPGPTLRSTVAAVFAAGILITMTTLHLTGVATAVDYRVAATLLIPMAAGFWLSGKLIRLVEGEHLKRAILIVCSIAGVALLVRGLAA